MTAIVDGERAGVGRGERIGTVTLVKGAVARMRRGGWRTLALWAGIFGVGWALQAAASAVVKPPLAGGFSPAQLIVQVLTAAVAGLGAALALRLFVQAPGRWLRLDRGLLECAGLMGGLTLIFSLTSLAYGLVMAGRTPGESAAGSIAVMVVYLLGVYALLKLTIWPICRLTGRSDVGFAAAWRLMRKATRGLIFGYLIFMIPFILAIAAAWSALRTGGVLDGPQQGIFLAIGAAYGIACYAMAATIYTLRVENPATVADLFD